MHAFWSGSLSFGLVNIPVSVFSAVSEQSLGFHMLHKTDLQPIHYKKVCEKGHEVPASEIVKGFEVSKGQFVVLEKADFESANVKKTHTVEIVSFVNRDEVDLMYYEHPYYLKAGKGGDKAYSLLRDALKKSDKVAVSRFVFRNREDLGIVLPHGDGLILNQIRFEHEIRAEEDMAYPKVKASKAEMDMALGLIKALSGPFKPKTYKDTYRDDLKALIAAKAKGKKFTAKEQEPEATNVKDLMTLLKQSLEGPAARTSKVRGTRQTGTKRRARATEAAPARKSRKKA